MNILMMTNTCAPMVGGLERSIAGFTAHYRRRGHRVIVVAPAHERMPAREKDVVRLPAVTRLTRAHFSVHLPIPGVLSKALRGVPLDIVHAHHPFFMGGTALRLAYARDVPLIFTHHTFFEHYTHFMPVDTPGMKRFVVRLATGYANLCDQVFAPSSSVRELLSQRGVRAPIAVVPTGVEPVRTSEQTGLRMRRDAGIPPSAFVVGHVGRLGIEKNTGFLARAVALFLRRDKQAHFLLVGEGPSKAEMLETFRRWGVAERVHAPGILQGPRLAAGYQAMDLFAFSSKSETQGLVLLEAMSAGVPVAAIRAPGVVDVLQEGKNGFLLERESPEEFAGAIRRYRRMEEAERLHLQKEARATSAEFSMARCADQALDLYGQVQGRRRPRRPFADSTWARTLRWLDGEWRLMKNFTGAAVAAVDAG